MPLFKWKKDRPNKPSAIETIGNVAKGLTRTPSNRSSKSTNSLPITPNTPDSFGEDADTGFSAGFANGFADSNQRPQTLVLSEAVLEEGRDVPAESLESPMRSSSRLSKTLAEVMRDKDALACLKAFMKTQRSEHLVQFWCDAESFRATTLSRVRSPHSLSSRCLKRRTESQSSSASEKMGCINEGGGETVQKGALGETSSHHLEESASCTDDIPKVKVELGGKQVEIDRTAPALPSEKKISHNSSVHQHTSLSPEATANIGGGHSKDSMPPLESPALETNPCDNKQSSLSLTLVSHPPKFQTKVPSMNPEQSSISSQTLTSPADCVSPHEPTKNTTNEGDEGQFLNPSNSAEGLAETTLSDNGDSCQGQLGDIAGKLKKSIERDAVTIFSTYIAKDAPKPIGVDDSLRAEVISKICHEDGKVDPESFIVCQTFVLSKIDAGYFQGFRDSAFHCRHQAHVLTTERVFLPDILLNENALCYFMEYMELEGVSDLMQVWMCASNFQQQLLASGGTYDAMQAQTDAMVIYDKYFSLQATNPVGFDDKLRFEIEENICREEGPLPDCFTKAKHIVLKMLEMNYFPSYLHSQIYHRYLSDLISTVQMDEDLPARPNIVAAGAPMTGNLGFKGHKRSESDASSEHSFSSASGPQGEVSTRNTLLAVDTRRNRSMSSGKGGKAKVSIEGDFSMSADMFNPDDLWKRPQANKLCLGSVTQLGQFVSDFDHDLLASDKRKTSIGPALFKKSKEKEKEEEEMALRIAQIIISDVNTMTQTGQSMAEIIKESDS